MSIHPLHPVPAEIAAKAWADKAAYERLYQASIDNPEAFWAEQGKRITWMKPYTQIKDVSYDAKDLHIRWFYDGTLNVSANCLDRHLPTRANQTAIIWEGDDPTQDKKITYQALYEEVCRFANGLKSLGVKKGDIVTIYMPMIPEATVAMLACTRIGAVHSVVFGGFSPEALAGRMEDGKSLYVITADEGVRAGRTIPLKRNVDAAVALLEEAGLKVSKAIVVKRTGANVPWTDGRDVHYEALIFY